MLHFDLPLDGHHNGLTIFYEIEKSFDFFAAFCNSVLKA
jgi:hypothetical protein